MDCGEDLIKNLLVLLVKVRGACPVQPLRLVEGTEKVTFGTTYEQEEQENPLSPSIGPEFS